MSLVIYSDQSLLWGSFIHKITAIGSKILFLFRGIEIKSRNANIYIQTKYGKSLEIPRWKISQNLCFKIIVWEFIKVPIRYDFRLYLVQVWFKDSNCHFRKSDKPVSRAHEFLKLPLILSTSNQKSWNSRGFKNMFEL